MRRGQQRRQKRGSSCDCSPCDLLDCLSILTFSMVVRMVLGVLSPSSIDPHTAAPSSLGGRVASRMVRSYQLHVSVPRNAPVCRLTPSCSRYGLQALSSHGLVRGGVLIGRRLRQCRSAGFVS